MANECVETDVVLFFKTVNGESDTVYEVYEIIQ